MGKTESTVDLTISAIKMSLLFLGDKTSKKIIEKQARDFMAMGQRRIKTTLNRFARTESVYAKQITCDIENDDNPPEGCPFTLEWVALMEKLKNRSRRKRKSLTVRHMKKHLLERG